MYLLQRLSSASGTCEVLQHCAQEWNWWIDSRVVYGLLSAGFSASIYEVQSWLTSPVQSITLSRKPSCSSLVTTSVSTGVCIGQIDNACCEYIGESCCFQCTCHKHYCFGRCKHMYSYLLLRKGRIESFMLEDAESMPCKILTPSQTATNFVKQEWKHIHDTQAENNGCPYDHRFA